MDCSQREDDGAYFPKDSREFFLALSNRRVGLVRPNRRCSRAIPSSFIKNSPERNEVANARGIDSSPRPRQCSDGASSALPRY